MDRNTLPATHRIDKSMGTGDHGLRPGTWWRVTRAGEPPAGSNEQVVQDYLKANEIADDILTRDWSANTGGTPEHGVVLLMSEARIVDEEVHTLILHPHPGWKNQKETRILSEHFALIMTPVPNGQELRVLEEDALAGRVTRLTAKMTEPPNMEDLEPRIAKAIEDNLVKSLKKDDAKNDDMPSIDPKMVEKLPAVLLPSRDLMAAEKMVAHEMAKAQVLGAVMSERVEEVNRAMSVVVRYKSETANVAMSRISGHLEEARKTMANVHTLKLWLGEGIGVRKLTGGAGAKPDEKIHFMQQLLFLDEEIFVQSMSDQGLTYEDLNSLPEIFSKNPALVRRMMPYERCVAIARVRNKSRNFEFTTDIRQMMQDDFEQEQERRVFLFVRDGEHVSMIQADEETSGAQRLFPSDREVDGIYTSNNWSDRGAAMDVANVRYSDARRTHEDRALFYKRFLLILWGAHERESILGSLPKGLNWLTGQTHMDHFTFVHDEELGLGVDRKPVMTWIKDLNERLRPGSRVMLNGNGLFEDQDRAPGAWTNPIHHSPERIREPVTQWGDYFVTQRGDDLVTQIPTRKYYDFEGTSLRNITFTLKGKQGPTYLPGGAWVMDDMTIGEMDAYIDSRKERKSHTRWMAAFSHIRPLIVARERAERALVERIEQGPEGRSMSPETRSMLARAAHEVVLASNWELPPRKADAKVVRMAQAISAAARIDMSDKNLEQVRITASGEIQCLSKTTPSLGPDLPDALWAQTTIRAGSTGKLGTSRKGLRKLDRYPRTGTLSLLDRTDEVWFKDASIARSGIVTPEDRIMMQSWLSVSREEFEESARRRITEMLTGQGDDIDESDLVSEILDNSSKHVTHPLERIPLGIILCPNPSSLRPDGQVSAQVLYARSDKLLRLWRRGGKHKETAIRVIDRVYKHADAGIATLLRADKSEAPTMRIGITSGFHPEGLSALIGDASALRGKILIAGKIKQDVRGATEEFTMDLSDMTDLKGMINFTSCQHHLNNYFQINQETLDMTLQAMEKTRLMISQEMQDLALAIINNTPLNMDPEGCTPTP